MTPAELDSLLGTDDFWKQVAIGHYLPEINARGYTYADAMNVIRDIYRQKRRTERN